MDSLLGKTNMDTPHSPSISCWALGHLYYQNYLKTATSLWQLGRAKAMETWDEGILILLLTNILANTLQDIIQLITRLSHVAFKRLGVPRNDGGSWSAHPIVVSPTKYTWRPSFNKIQVKPLQFNGYDCGLWVLAQITAVLRGYDITNLREGDMPEFCHYLQSLVLSIPVPGK